MDKKNILVAGGSSGIGLELVRSLNDKHYEIYAGLRTLRMLAELPEVHHLALDVSADALDLDALPEILHGLAYCPGSIVLKPFQGLPADDFLADFK